MSVCVCLHSKEKIRKMPVAVGGGEGREGEEMNAYKLGNPLNCTVLYSETSILLCEVLCLYLFVLLFHSKV